MESVTASWLPFGLVEAVAAMPHGMVLLPLLLGLLAMAVATFSSPGALTPTAFVSGLLLGFGGILIVAIGAAVGCHLLFVASRRWLGGAMRARFGTRLDSIGSHLEKRGPLYVATARLGGVPFALVTAGCAAAPISARSFAGANLLGMLPAITLAVSAGSAL